MSTAHTAAAVDRAMLLVIAPELLGPEGEALALEAVGRGLAVLVATPGDGWHPVRPHREGLVIGPPHWCETTADALHPMTGDEALGWLALMAGEPEPTPPAVADLEAARAARRPPPPPNPARARLGARAHRPDQAGPMGPSGRPSA